MVVVDLVAVVDEAEDVRASGVRRRASDRLMRDMGLRRIAVACAEACGVSCCEAAVLPSRQTSAAVKVNYQVNRPVIALRALALAFAVLAASGGSVRAVYTDQRDTSGSGKQTY